MNIKLSPEIAAGFVEEVRGYFAQMREGFAVWANGQEGALDEARRYAHTIKGAAAMIGLPALAHVSLLLEDTLRASNAGPAVPNDMRPGLFAACVEHLQNYADGLLEGERPGPELAAAILCLRRARGEDAGGDAEAVRNALGSEAAPAVRSGAPNTGTAEVVSEDLLAHFRHEAEDQLHAIGRSLRMLESQRDNKEILRALRRSIHSLKGASQSVGLEALTELTHRMEDLLDSLTGEQLGFSRQIERLLFTTFDTITDLATGESNEAAIWNRVHELRAQYTAVLSSQGQAGTVFPSDEDELPPVGEDDESEDIPTDFLEVFRQEADDHLNTIAAQLRALEASPGNKDAMQEIRRAVHTLKGAAGVIGFNSVARLSHRLEDLLDGLWDGSVAPGATPLQLLFAGADTLNDLITDPDKRAAARETARGLHDRLDAELAGRADAVTKVTRGEAEAEDVVSPGTGIEVPGSAAQHAPVAMESGSAAKSAIVRVPIERLDEMVRLVSELIVSRSVFEQYLDAYRRDVEELRLSLGRLRRLSSKFDTDFEVQALLGGPSGRVGSLTDKRAEFDALEFDRYTDLHLASRDLSETTTDINVAVNQLSQRSGDFESYLSRLGRLTSDIQDRLMRMRMVPLANIATRLHRTVRVTAEKLGKPVDLVLDGERVEMDKTALEELAGPLEHLLRNALDHGIESEADRVAAGKRARGTVTVRAYYLGTQVVVEVSDDGRGMNARAIAQKAIARGELTEAEAASMREDELLALAFRPGFSTAAEVSDISGRGVGLDVVKAAVERLKGTLTIEARPGAGTSFLLRLPMSLAILRVLMVRAKGETFAVPLGAVTRILRLEPGQLEQIGHHSVLRLDNQVLPALRLDDALGTVRGASEEGPASPPVLIVDLGGRQAALIVDELLLAREVVVKTLGSLIRKVQGVTGVTIRGDGGIVLIINPQELFELNRGVTPVGASSARPVRARPAQNGYDVLVVDDSVSVRRVLSSVIQSHGWRAVAAKDGVEALEMLQAGRAVDALVLDMEMPRMDGYELLTLLRGQPAFAKLPVVMLTSRAAEKHRSKAMALGANDYLVKPAQDEVLLAAISKAIREQREALVG